MNRMAYCLSCGVVTIWWHTDRREHIMTELPNGLRIFSVQRMVNGEVRTYNVAARNAADAARKADESAARDRSAA